MTRELTGLTRDNRGVSSTVSYALTLGISSLLLVGLVTAGGTILQDENEQTTREELTIIGNRLATQISFADQTVQRTNTNSLEFKAGVPNEVSGREFIIDITATAITLRDPETGIEVEIPVTTDTPIEEGTITSGELYIVYDGTDITIERRPLP